MQEYVTTKGHTIRTDTTYHDRRPTNRRTLRVDRIHEPRHANYPDDREIDCTVIAVDGESVTERATTMTARRLGGRDFVLIEAEQ